jgi:hypothetical protein
MARKKKKEKIKYTEEEIKKSKLAEKLFGVDAHTDFLKNPQQENIQKILQNSEAKYKNSDDVIIQTENFTDK